MTGIEPHHHGPIHEWIRHGSYPALFAVLLCCGLGLPIPEDIPLITAGGLIFQHEMNIYLAAICAWCGIIGGDCILYCLGRKFGPDVSKIPIIGRHVDVRRIARMEKWFAQYGIWVVAVGRMFAGVRGVMVVVAGTSKFKFWKFVIADGLAAIVSGGLFMFLGYKFAKNLGRLEEVKHHIKAAMAIGLVVLVVGIGGYVWWRNRRKSGRDEGKPVDKVNDAPPSGATPSAESV
ncbi:MAG TPA: DedA family protein [Tepidisphaeraceae bacterium]|jgi:membrane protein DedA with SNARE-associated domain|nr:DedA family protein [Tepidisphaeraceae bacterium]